MRIVENRSGGDAKLIVALAASLERSANDMWETNPLNPLE
jgi:hypothetical protein